MLSLLVVMDERAGAQVPDLDGFRLDRVRVREAATRLAATPYDAVLVHVGTDGHVAINAVNAIVGLAAARRDLPVLVTADDPTTATASLLRATLVDGFVDLRWGAELLAAAVALTIAAVRKERRALEAQDAFMNAALGEAERFQELAYRDDLTLLSNRRYFEYVIQKEHARCERFGNPYALVFVDLDNLKQVNSQHGHLAGGRVLEQVGQFIHDLTRKCDFAFRFGGDEFVVLLVDTDKHGATAYGERLCAGVRNLRLEVADAEVRVTASAGVAAYPEDGQTPTAILHHADTAVFAAKERGKSCVVPFSESLTPRST